MFGWIEFRGELGTRLPASRPRKQLKSLGTFTLSCSGMTKYEKPTPNAWKLLGGPTISSGAAAYLERSNEKNLPFYQSHGFRVVDALRLIMNGPTLWLMSREPHAT